MNKNESMQDLAVRLAFETGKPVHITSEIVYQCGPLCQPSCSSCGGYLASYRQRMRDGEIWWLWHWSPRRPLSILLSEVRLGEFTGRKSYMSAFRFWPGHALGRFRRWKRRRALPQARVVQR